jgi:hypothetical protein
VIDPIRQSVDAEPDFTDKSSNYTKLHIRQHACQMDQSAPPGRPIGGCGIRDSVDLSKKDSSARHPVYLTVHEPILVINAGSSSVKFSAFETTADRSLSAGIHGQVSGIGSAPRLEVTPGAQILSARKPQGRFLVKRAPLGQTQRIRAVE